jgi:hypothetical protein
LRARKFDATFLKSGFDAMVVMDDPSAPPGSPVESRLPNHLAVEESTLVSISASLGTIRNILEELLQTKKRSKFGTSEWISLGALVVALIAMGISRGQYLIAQETPHGSYLLQLSKDTKELSDTVMKSTPSIDDIVSKACREERGDLNYSNTYAQAQFELGKIVDFFDFYYNAYKQYDLITKETWGEVCSGAKPLLSRNCFYHVEWNSAVAQRTGLSEGLALCGAK